MAQLACDHVVVSFELRSMAIVDVVPQNDEQAGVRPARTATWPLLYETCVRAWLTFDTDGSALFGQRLVSGTQRETLDDFVTRGQRIGRRTGVHLAYTDAP